MAAILFWIFASAYTAKTEIRHKRCVAIGIGLVLEFYVPVVDSAGCIEFSFLYGFVYCISDDWSTQYTGRESIWSYNQYLSGIIIGRISL